MAQENWIVRNKWWVGAGLAVAIIGVVLYANRSKVKTVLKEKLGGQGWFDTSLSWWRDAKTKGIIDKLHPQFKDKAAEFFARVEKELGLKMIATSGLRTFAEQQVLRDKNKLPPYPKNAAAGLSDHNYGFALDLNVLDKNGKAILLKATPKAEWEKSGIPQIAKSMGMEWGGDYVGYYDPVHFALAPKGMKSSQLLALHNSGKVDTNGYVIV